MKLADYVSKLQSKAENPLAKAVERVRKEGLRLIDDSFKTETGPYGETWPTVAPHKGHRGILQDTRNLRDSWMAFAIGSMIRFSNPLRYACRQNYGYLATGQPARRMIPSANLGWPETWKNMVKLAILEAGQRVYEVKS